MISQSCENVSLTEAGVRRVYAKQIIAADGVDDP